MYWQPEDTPDTYLVRIQRNAEYDLPPLPLKKVPELDELGFTVYMNGRPKMIDNPEYARAEQMRTTFKSSHDVRLKRAYIDGLKPSLRRKLTAPPDDMDQLHALVRKMYIHETQHPESTFDTYEQKGKGQQQALTSFIAQAMQREDKMEKMEKTMDNIKDVTEQLAKGIMNLTEPGAVQPTARAGTMRDSAPVEPPQRRCFICNEAGHMARDCPKKDTRFQAYPPRGGQMRGGQRQIPAGRQENFQNPRQFRTQGQNQQQYQGQFGPRQFGQRQFGQFNPTRQPFGQRQQFGQFQARQPFGQFTQRQQFGQQFGSGQNRPFREQNPPRGPMQQMQNSGRGTGRQFQPTGRNQMQMQQGQFPQRGPGGQFQRAQPRESTEEMMERAAEKAIAQFTAKQDTQGEQQKKNQEQPNHQEGNLESNNIQANMMELLSQMHMQWLDDTYGGEYQKND
jgi:hypothetical protein